MAAFWNVKAYLNTCLNMKDLGSLKYFLAEVAEIPKAYIFV